jgi:hypothetical protein
MRAKGGRILFGDMVVAKVRWGVLECRDLSANRVNLRCGGRCPNIEYCTPKRFCQINRVMTVIQAAGHVRPKPAQQILEQIHTLANKITKPARHRAELKIMWISGHDEVDGNEAADAEAKKAASGESSQISELPNYLRTKPLLHSTTAACQTYRIGARKAFREHWMASPCHARMSNIDEHLPSQSYLKDIGSLTRAQASLITQLRTGHAPLNKHLHRIRKVPSPLCPACNKADETVHHLLFECHTHEHACHGLRRKLGRKATSIKELLGEPKSMRVLIEFIAATG